jgi:hypothetical protein
LESAVLRSFAVVTVVATALGFGLSQAESGTTQKPRATAIGVIFSAEKTERVSRDYKMAELHPPYWTPDKKDIDRLENMIAVHLRSIEMPAAQRLSTRLPGYKRQYFGYSIDGQKWIFVNGFCADVWRQDDSWVDTFVGYLDGGDCFFRIHYDVTKTRFERFEINGEA